MQPRDLETNAIRAGVALGGALFVLALASFVWRALSRDFTGTEPLLLYEASRVQRGLALFVDPARGALDDGPIVVRHVQLYTPVWTWLLARLPLASMGIVGRLASIAAWFGAVAALIATAPRDRRPLAALVGLSYGGLFLLGRAACSVAADSTAAVVAAIALVVAMRAGRLTLLAAALATAAAVLKPQVVGIGAGLVIADLAARRREALPAVGALLAMGVAAVATLQLATHGQWLVHLRLTAQSAMSPHRWLGYLVDYALVLGLPHAAVAALSARGSRAEGRAPFGAIALGVATAWAAFAMGKHGSATNYWLEPTLAMIVVLARGPRLPSLAPPARRLALAAPALPLVFAALGAYDLHQQRALPAMIATRAAWVREVCPLGPGRTLIASDPSLELAATGKVAFPAWSLAFAVRERKLPVAALAEPLESPATTCFVNDRRLEAPYVLADPASEAPIWDVELRDTILARYTFTASRHGVYVYARGPR